MTTAQAVLMAALLVFLCAVLIWMTLQATHHTGHRSADKKDDRERVLDVVSGLDDRFSKAVYKKAYHLGDDELSK